MKLFDCQVCGQTLYFENTRCERCGHRLGYLADKQSLDAVERAGQEDSLEWRLVGREERRFKFCKNAEYDACNWLIPADAPGEFCIACRHNHTVPDLSSDANQSLWRLMELAKHRLFYTLLELKLPLVTRVEDPNEGLVFDFLADPPDGQKVMTGHDQGRITIAVAEADDAEREKRRKSMHEPYRTLLGHFRHEVAHYYWDRLVRGSSALEPCRAVFGDEREDYMAALQRHYKNGAPPDWRERFVSAYATSHAWEDFAETFAHYLHIVDTLETAQAFGLKVRPHGVAQAEALRAEVDFKPDEAKSFEPLIKTWLPMTFALNSLNRSMGMGDLYPFVLSPGVIQKLTFIHDLVHGTVGRSVPPPSEDELAPVPTSAPPPPGPANSDSA